MLAYGDGKEEQSAMKKKLGQINMGDMIQFGLRLVAIGTSTAATSFMFTSHQTSPVFGVEMDAKYSYSPAFKFFAFANAIASVFAFMSLSLTLFIWINRLEAAKQHFFFFLHDLGVMCLLVAGCSAATAIGYVGRYGNNHAGWLPICDNFSSFCHRITAAIAFGFCSVFAFLLLTVLSATACSASCAARFSPLQVQSTCATPPN